MVLLGKEVIFSLVYLKIKIKKKESKTVITLSKARKYSFTMMTINHYFQIF